MNRIAVTLGVLALVAIAGFAGTQAFYSDTETSEDNIFTAGSVDLRVDHTRQTYNGMDCETCSVELYSGDGQNMVVDGTNAEKDSFSYSAEEVSSPHPDWDDSHSTADWIWATDPTLPNDDGGDGNDTTYVFERTFQWNGTAANIDLNLDVGSDNSYVMGLNGTQVSTGSGFASIDSETLSNELQNGQNTLTIEVTNHYNSDFPDSNNPDDNPGGLLYYLLIERDQEECEDDSAFQQACMLWQEQDLSGNETFFNFADIKPGDWGTNQISLHSDDNDAYACLVAHDGENDENGVVDPELDAGDDTADGPGEGELQNYLNFFAWIDENENGEYDSGETDLGTSSLANLNATLAGLDSNNGENLTGSQVEYIGLEWCAGDISVDHNSGEVTCDGSGMLNDAQTDSFGSSLTAYAEQTRNNDDFSCAGVLGGENGEELGCSDEADVMLVLDSSGSISDDEMDSMKSDAKSFISTLGPTENGVNIGVVDFDADGTVEQGLTHDVSDLESAIDGMVDGGSTNMTEGIQVAHDELVNNGRSGAPNFMIVLTDGEPDSGTETDAANAAASARNDSTIYAIGAGSGANETFLKDSIVSSDSDDHYFSASNFSEVESQFDQLLTCDPQGAAA